ncbi:MAG: M6 family metalloprotease domain-containing protein [Candidatus Eisenbacteria bacterium]|nr:M6 family metalloprotease domain-containing protein [Candidatus Eisenbacteria bacterium]
MTRSILILCGLLVFLSRDGLAVSFPPDEIMRLRREGRVSELAAIEKRKALLGVDRIDDRFSFNMNKYPASSTVKLNIAVILVDFWDVPADSVKFPRAHFDSLLFSKDTYPTGSLRDYYLKSSYGRLDLGGKIVGWFRMPHQYSYYSLPPNHGLGPYPANAQLMASDAIKAADPLVNYSLFDSDGPDGVADSGDDDGFVDAVFVIHAGRGYEESFDDRDIVSHQWMLRDDLSVDFVKVRYYATGPHDGKIGTLAHELGHLLGLPDLYDTTYRSFGLGYWSLMAWGSWTGNPRGARPVGFDAYCKAKLGFVNPTVPKANISGVSVPPVETSASILKLWTYGNEGSQYFLAENRRMQGVDQFIPGEGLLVYHVDESVFSNDDSSHYRVALEQADGESNLECYSGPACNTGDTGDPFPGNAGKTRFGADTTPSSRNYSGFDTQTEIKNIYELGDTVMADFSVEVIPFPNVTRYYLTDSTVSGTPNGYLEPGEKGKLRLKIINEGSDLTDMSLRVLEDDAKVTMDVDSLLLGPLVARDSIVTGQDIVFSFGSDAPTGTYGIWFKVRFYEGSTFLDQDSILVAAGGPSNFLEDVESGAGGWVHLPCEGTTDEWHVSDMRSSSPSHSWKCGATLVGNPYSSDQDAVLVTPLLNLNPGSTLSFKYWVEAEVLTPALALDGGMVEVSEGGGPFVPVEPEGGYPYRVFSSSPDGKLAGRGVFSGASTDQSPTGWLDAGFNLGELSGSVRFRFRFFTDGSGDLEGWYIDDVRVETPTPTGLELSDILCTKEGALLIWRSSERYLYFDILRAGSPSIDQAHQVNAGRISGEENTPINFLDKEADAREPWYFVRGAGRDGKADLFGPWSLECGSRGIREIAFDRNPFPGKLKIFLTGFTGSGMSELKIEVFDVMGRCVRRLGEESPGVWRWDGRDAHGLDLPSGVYLFKSTAGEAVAAKKAVLLR